ncbi:MAG: hypothetical protein KAY24_03495 [Candidatus Eisenbacteria sp.]|nr:hypothetical protein [Candidatus Eisenbacteria bacterium]
MFPLFVLLWSFLALAAIVIVVMLIVKAVNHSQKLRFEAIVAMIQKGVYEPRLLEPQAGSIITLGWGIALISIGAAIMVGLLVLGKTAALIVGLIPLFLGVGLVITQWLVRRQSAIAARSTEPFPASLQGLASHSGSPDDDRGQAPPQDGD